MRIQHNIMAMNAYRNYNNNTSALSKNLEKLSSGYKINRAGDDAAGLAISEKMRAQITGLDAATKNVKDGISLVKTGEGAMQEIHDMLNRMTYLATQSANGTYDNEVDRANLQKEVKSLSAEIDRIADSANFNGINLLDGSMEQKTVVTNPADVAVTAVKDGALAAEGQAGVFSFDFSNVGGTNNDNGEQNVTIGFAGKTITMAVQAGKSYTGADIAKAIEKEFQNAGQLENGLPNAAGDTNFAVDVAVDGSKVTISMKEVPTKDFDLDLSVTVTPGTNITGTQAEQFAATIEKEAITKGERLYAQGTFTLDDTIVKDGGTLTIGEETYTFAVGKDSEYKTGANVIDLTDYEQAEINANIKSVAARLSAAAVGNSQFKVGANNQDGEISLTEKAGAFKNYDTFDLAGTVGAADAPWTGVVKSGIVDATKSTGGLSLQIGDTSDSFNRLTVSISDMHVDALGIGNIDISTQEGASAAIDKIKSAINSVSSTRGDLGAIQNRLEHTQNNLSVMAENIQDAESTIRDTDVADEMMAYTKNNILIQSAQAMLAQANQVPQGVLQLLQ